MVESLYFLDEDGGNLSFLDSLFDLMSSAASVSFFSRLNSMKLHTPVPLNLLVWPVAYLMRLPVDAMDLHSVKISQK